MMEQKTGTFELIELGKEARSKDELAEELRRIEAKAKRPTLYVGEVVEVKGVKFRVTRIKADGKLGLKMLAIPRADEKS